MRYKIVFDDSIDPHSTTRHSLTIASALLATMVANLQDAGKVIFSIERVRS